MPTGLRWEDRAVHTLIFWVDLNRGDVGPFLWKQDVEMFHQKDLYKLFSDDVWDAIVLFFFVFLSLWGR